MEMGQVMPTWGVVELGVSGNRKYFLKTQAIDPDNLEGSSGILINIHKTQLPLPSGRCPHRVGPLC